jgi:hypothetical protein
MAAPEREKEQKGGGFLANLLGPLVAGLGGAAMGAMLPERERGAFSRAYTGELETQRELARRAEEAREGRRRQSAMIVANMLQTHPELMQMENVTYEDVQGFIEPLAEYIQVPGQEIFQRYHELPQEQPEFPAGAFANLLGMPNVPPEIKEAILASLEQAYPGVTFPEGAFGEGTAFDPFAAVMEAAPKGANVRYLDIDSYMEAAAKRDPTKLKFREPKGTPRELSEEEILFRQAVLEGQDSDLHRMVVAKRLGINDDNVFDAEAAGSAAVRAMSTELSLSMLESLSEGEDQAVAQERALALMDRVTPLMGEAMKKIATEIETRMPKATKQEKAAAVIQAHQKWLQQQLPVETGRKPAPTPQQQAKRDEDARIEELINQGFSDSEIKRILEEEFGPEEGAP